MSVENGICPSCHASLVLDSSKEKMKCPYCGREQDVKKAIEKLQIDGVAGFDTIMLKAQRAWEFDEDFDKAEKYYKEALELQPDDYRALWGAFLCETAAINYARRFKGYVQVPGDIPENLQSAIRRYGNRAYNNAPDDTKPYYFDEMNKIRASFAPGEKKKKKGCYIATSVYGSYNCPEVWVLRRYRDFKLGSNPFGRLFIKIYYLLSPVAVKLFGKRKWFNGFWKSRLDKKVKKLKGEGYPDTPYSDL